MTASFLSAGKSPKRALRRSPPETTNPDMATHKLFLLPGDGIGPEVMAEAAKLNEGRGAAIIDIVVLSFYFGCIARFSNGGWKNP